MKRFNDDDVKTIVPAIPFRDEDFFLIPDENGNIDEKFLSGQNYPGYDSSSYWNF